MTTDNPRQTLPQTCNCERLMGYDVTRIKRALCIITGIAALAATLISLSWRMVQDVPVMLYQANLMARHGAMPYRDFFCINLPGSLWLFELIIRLLGVSDFSVHLANVFVVTAISGLFYLAFSKSCRYCVLVGVALGALRIFSAEGFFVLQRELIALVPIAGLFAIALRDVRYVPLKSIAAGLLMAWLALIKPQLVLYGVPFAVLFWVESAGWRERVRFFFGMGVAFCVPLLICFLWIIRNGAWDGFKETLAYWPLYGQMTFSYTFVNTAARIQVMVSNLFKMLCSPHAIVAYLGLAAGHWNGMFPKRQTFLLGGLLALSAIVPAISGQCWIYHQLPFFYLTLFAAGFLLSGCKCLTLLGMALAVFWVGFTGAHVYRETTQSSVTRIKHNVPDAFANHLRRHAAPGDRAQPIDWTYGALYGMLVTDTLPATRFIEFSYFLHSVSTPFIQSLRNEFLTSLRERPPRFLLEATSEKYPNGLDTEKQFQAFEDWRDTHYRVADEGERYRIWELRTQ